MASALDSSLGSTKKDEGERHLGAQNQGTGEFPRPAALASAWPGAAAAGTRGAATESRARGFADSGFSIPAYSRTLHWGPGAMFSPQRVNQKMHWADQNCCFFHAHAHTHTHRLSCFKFGQCKPQWR